MQLIKKKNDKLQHFYQRCLKEKARKLQDTFTKIHSKYAKKTLNVTKNRKKPEIFQRASFKAIVKVGFELANIDLLNKPGFPTGLCDLYC